MTYSSDVANDGSFTIRGLFPGEYRVRLGCYGAYPVSVSFGEVDLLKDRALQISTDAALPPIEIKYKRGGGLLKIKFRNPIPLHGAALLVPNFYPSLGPVLQFTSKAALRLVQDLVVNLAPGEYRFYALADYEGIAFRDPTSLKTLSAGTTVQIEEGHTSDITIESFLR